VGVANLTYFLRAGLISEQMEEIYQKAFHASVLLQKQQKKKGADSQMTSGLFPDDELTASTNHWTHQKEIQTALLAIMKSAQQVRQLLDQFPCEPLIYTGEGSTDEVIHMLEGLLVAQRKRKSRTAAKRRRRL
jgi:uncharacterized Zn finger protein